jgi:hypothetical protein
VSAPPESRRLASPPAGLCNTCVHQQVVRTTRGSVFSLCRRSRDDAEHFLRYPRLPVVRCEGWERTPPEPDRPQ